MDVQMIEDMLKRRIDDCLRRGCSYSSIQLSAYRDVLGFIMGAREEEARILSDDKAV